MKKQFFTTAIAFIAALSLSASAFAADGGSAAVGLSVGGSNIGSSTTEDVTLTDNVTTISGVINENLTVSAEVSKSLFPDYVSVSMNVSVNDVDEGAAEVDKLKDILKAAWNNRGSDAKINQAFDITFTGKKADGTVDTNAQPARGKSIRISFNTLDDSNAIFDLETGETNYSKALIALARTSNGISWFRAPHFSTYYTVKVDNSIAATLLAGDTEDDDNNNNNGGNNGGNNNGGNNSGSSDNNNNNNNNGDSTTTTDSSSDNNNNNNNNNNGGTTTTQAPTDNGNGNGGNGDVSDGGNNSNTGNTGDGAGNDKNQATGVVLAVVPAAAAAVAVIISKKRK